MTSSEGRQDISAVVSALRVIAGAAGRRVLERELLRDWHATHDCDVVIFSYSADFSLLWGLGDDAGGLGAIAQCLHNSLTESKELSLLVVWDDTPVGSDVIDVRNFISPYDWAVALSIAIYSKFTDDMESGPKLRIQIIDAAGNQSDANYIQRSFFAFHNLYPWIQDYRLVVTTIDGCVSDKVLAAIFKDNVHEYSTSRQVVPPTHRGSERLVNDLGNSECILTTFNYLDDHSARKAGLETLLYAWQQECSASGNRHSIANIIGPLYMAGGLPTESMHTVRDAIIGGSSARLALLELLRVLELIPVLHGKECMEVCGIHLSPAFMHDKLRVLLVDDQHDQGFHHIVGAVLYGKFYIPGNYVDNAYNGENIDFRTEAAAKSIFDSLKAGDANIDWDWPRELRIGADILLLDLRLWLHTQTDVRHKFFKCVLEVCERLGVDALVRKDAKFQKALMAARGLLEGGDGDEVTALALFPLLLSYYDPSFPIMLFSSTNQRRLVDMFSHRNNLNVEFAKPLVGGDSEKEMPSASVRRLSTALVKAVRQYETRVVWQQLARLSPSKIQMPQVPAIGSWGTITAISLLSENDIIKRMAGLYEQYIVAQRFSDFISIPWEFLEALLSPEHREALGDYKFKVVGKNIAALGFTLRQTRHRKAHGNFLSKEYENSEPWSPDMQTCAVLLFLFLICILAPRDEKNTFDIVSLEKRFTDHLRAKYSGLGGESGRDIICSPKSFAKINGGEYVLAALLSGAARNQNSLSWKTLDILSGVTSELID